MKLLENGEGWCKVGRRWLKFSSVGAIGIGVQLTTLTVLAGGLDLNYLLATGLAVEAAVLHNFIWHERWTWRDRTRLSRADTLRRLVRFHLTTGAQSIVGNLGFMRLLVGSLHLHYLFANFLTIAACSIINFLVSDRFVFQPSAWQIRKFRDSVAADGPEGGRARGSA
ncbi:MAG: GtrA family protein [Terriglobia bacterium]